MVSKRQLEKEKKYLAKKRKDKKKKAKKVDTISLKEPENQENQPQESIEIIDNDIDTYLQENSIDPTFHEVFKKFYAEPAIPQETEPQEEFQEEQAISQETILSKKKLRKLARPSIFHLKQAVKRPEVVEWVDTTAKDPSFLVYLKSYKNTVQVPKHWSQKKKFLQMKRGTEKMPFTLPDFIEATGITKIRAQMRERDAGKLLKQRMRERMNPKLGRLDIDYQILHDAFFKHQTKPKMTIHGDIYHEGKENELKMRVYRPGQLSDELRLALGMPEGCPPPWIINMQRFGPPPAYPHLRIPGLNAPIPEGAQFGYQMGGWGNPESGIYGNTLNNNGNNPENANKKKHWGELEDEIEIEEESEGEESPEDTSTFIRNTAFSGFADLTPLIIDQKQMIQGTQTTVGYETPAPVDIKKKINK